MDNSNGTVDNAVCSSELVNGSRDVWSCNDSDSSTADHLVIMVHGILGSSSDWKYGAEQFVRNLPDKVFVHCSERNMSRLTLDGVDVMGERLAQEVLEVIEKRPNLRKISFVAHSVGGLVARYCIGKLYKPPRKEDEEGPNEEDLSSTIGGLEAVNFITVATPHLGSRGNRQVPFLFGFNALEKTAGLVIHWIFRRTGQHLFLVDNDEGKPPLLKRMIEDHGDLNFMSALRAFKRRVAYSNVGYDHIVGWRTSSIRRNNELPKAVLEFSNMFFSFAASQCCHVQLNYVFVVLLQWEECLNEKYPHVVHEEHCKASDTDEADIVSTVDDKPDKIEEELVAGLTRVSWEKVDVSFHSSRQRFAAHSVIQVKDESMHREGADVVQHMIDHFVL
ncbi:Putative lipase ROG1 [Linum perenne]